MNSAGVRKRATAPVSPCGRASATMAGRQTKGIADISRSDPARDWRFWLIVPLLAVLPLFFVSGPAWTSAPVYQAAWSQGHMLYFVLLAVWAGSLVRLHTPRRWLLLSLGILALSLAIEGIQAQSGRTASAQDVLRNLIGTWLGLFWSLGPDKRVWAGRAVATGLAVWQLSGFADQVLDHRYRLQQFPVLANFEHARDLAGWQGTIERVRQPAAEGRYSLAVRLNTERYSGARLEHLPGDWHAYEQLRLSIFNPDEDLLKLTLRLNDEAHQRHGNRFDDRFNRRLTVAPGWNEVRIDRADVPTAPADREMDLTRMQRLGIFATRLPGKRTIYLDDVRLSNL